MPSETNTEQANNVKLNKYKNLPYYRQPWVRWIVLGAGIVASLLASIQSSSLIVALVDLIVHLDATMITIIWVLMGYIIAVTAAVMLSGPIADFFGKGKVLLVGYLVFTVGSLLCGFSQKENKGIDLVGYRVVQGIGAGLLFSTSTALVVDRFIEFNQVGLTQGVMFVAFAIGSAIGPLIGGSLALVSWSWIFFINVPFGGVAFIISAIFIRDTRKNHHLKDKKRRELLRIFDWSGVILFSIFVTFLLLVIVASIFPSGPISSVLALSLMGCIAAVSLVAFIIVELYTKHPFIKFSIFKNKNITIPLVATTLASFARGNINFGSIFLFQGPLLQDPFMAGVLLIPFGVGVLLGGFPAGKIADKIGSKVLVILGPFLAAIGLIPAFIFQASYSYWIFALSLFLSGIGLGVFNSPNQRTLMLAINPKDRGLAASLNLMLTMFAQSFSIILAFSIVLSSISYESLLQLFIYANSSELVDHPEVGTKFMNGIHIIFYITAGTLIIPAIIGFFTDNIFSVPKVAPSAKNDEEKSKQNIDKSVEKISVNEPSTTNNDKSIIAPTSTTIEKSENNDSSNVVEKDETSKVDSSTSEEQ